MRDTTIHPCLHPDAVHEDPLRAAQWVLDRLGILGGTASALHEQVAHLQSQALLHGEYPELEQALLGLAAGQISSRLLAKHAGTGRYAAARLGWQHAGRGHNDRGTGLDSWLAFVRHCAKLPH